MREGMDLNVKSKLLWIDDSLKIKKTDFANGAGFLIRCMRLFAVIRAELTPSVFRHCPR